MLWNSEGLVWKLFWVSKFMFEMLWSSEGLVWNSLELQCFFFHFGRAPVSVVNDCFRLPPEMRMSQPRMRMSSVSCCLEMRMSQPRMMVVRMMVKWPTYHSHKRHGYHSHQPRMRWREMFRMPWLACSGLGRRRRKTGHGPRGLRVLRKFDMMPTSGDEKLPRSSLQSRIVDVASVEMPMVVIKRGEIIIETGWGWCVILCIMIDQWSMSCK